MIRDRGLRREFLELFFTEQEGLAAINKALGRDRILGDGVRAVPADEAFAQRWRAAEEAAVAGGAAREFPFDDALHDVGSDPTQPAVAVLLQVHQRAADLLHDAVEGDGWPGRRRVGRAGAVAAEFLLGHLDHYDELRSAALPLMRVAVMQKEADARRYGHVVDRVCARAATPQQFGTIRIPNGGVPRFEYPADDEALIDARRAEIGLPTLSSDAAAFAAGAKPGPALGPFRARDYVRVFAPMAPAALVRQLRGRQRRPHFA